VGTIPPRQYPLQFYSCDIVTIIPYRYKTDSECSAILIARRHGDRNRIVCVYDPKRLSAARAVWIAASQVIRLIDFEVLLASAPKRVYG